MGIRSSFFVSLFFLELKVSPIPFDPMAYSAAVDLPVIHKGRFYESFGGLARVYSLVPDGPTGCVTHLAVNNSEKDTLVVDLKASSSSASVISSQRTLDTTTFVPALSSMIVNHILPACESSSWSTGATMALRWLHDSTGPEVDATTTDAKLLKCFDLRRLQIPHKNAHETEEADEDIQNLWTRNGNQR
jgi:hypothetical protein